MIKLSLRSRKVKIIAGGSIAGAVIMLFILLGPPGLLKYTSTPEFCSSCHVMEYQYDSWLKSSPHKNIKCVDCHLPNNNIVNHLVWKGIDGMKDVIYFYGRIYSDDIRATNHAKKVIHANCVKCHGEMVSRISTDGAKCWTCHRRINHKTADLGHMQIIK